MALGLRCSGSLAPSLPLLSAPPKPKVVCTKLKHCCYSLAELLDREWMMPAPDAQVHKISVSEAPVQLPPGGGNNLSRFSFLNGGRLARGAGKVQKRDGELSFYVVRDDLLHPLVNGNKARKLDALLPALQLHGATDVVTCGGCQSAHAAAVAVSCAERRIRPHLLLRGEQLEVPTGYNLVSLMYGKTTYVARSVYAKREEMLLKHATSVAGSNGSVVWVDDILDKTSNCRNPLVNIGPFDGDRNALSQAEAEIGSRRVVIVSEGAGNVVGLLGVIRLAKYLSQDHLFGSEQEIELIVDAGTGTTAIGLALGAACLGLPWRITAVMLADTIESYRKQEECLISGFKSFYRLEYPEQVLHGVNNIVHWVERIRPRKFGKMLKGEFELCQQIAQETGILVDPVYTLAAWEQAVLYLGEAKRHTKVVMLHTGGTLGVFGLAQRYTAHFHAAEPPAVHVF